MLSSEDQILI